MRQTSIVGAEARKSVFSSGTARSSDVDPPEITHTFQRRPYIRNTSGIAATDVLVRSRIPKIDGVQLHDYEGRPEMPSKHSLIPNIRPLAQQLAKRPEPVVADFPDHWQLTMPFGTVLPKDTVWSAGLIYLGSTESRRVDFPIEVFAANLPSPLSFTLRIDVAVTTRPMTLDDLPYGSLR